MWGLPIDSPFIKLRGRMVGTYVSVPSREMMTCWISIGMVIEFSRTLTHSPSLHKA